MDQRGHQMLRFLMFHIYTAGDTNPSKKIHDTCSVKQSSIYSDIGCGQIKDDKTHLVLGCMDY